jgi:signal peptidase I
VLFTPFIVILSLDMQDENQSTTTDSPQTNPPVVNAENSLENQVQVTPEKPNQQMPKKRKEGGLVSFVATLAVAFVLVQVINMFFFQSYKVFGSSMFPTLHDGDRLIISKVGKTGARILGKDYEPKRGDIIVFIDPQRDDLQLIKRVIGLPGERVVVKDGSLTVYNQANPNGFNPDTTGEYTADLPATSGENDVTVPEKNLFVSGDNREGSNSLDSRNELGTVPEELVVGTLKVRLFPFDSAKFF